MIYHSTQDSTKSVASAQAIAQGISQDGGLFVPERFPRLSALDLRTMLDMSYRERAKFIISMYLTDFSAEEINDCVDSAYTADKFGSDEPAPLAAVTYNGAELNLLELKLNTSIYMIWSVQVVEVVLSVK